MGQKENEGKPSRLSPLVKISRKVVDANSLEELQTSLNELQTVDAPDEYKRIVFNSILIKAKNLGLRKKLLELNKQTGSLLTTIDIIKKAKKKKII